jgi:TonB family protein
LIHFDLEDRYQDELVVGRAISAREGVLLSIIVHMALIIALLVAPSLSIFQPSPEEIEAKRQEQQRELERQRDRQRFVFVDPQVDLKALRPPPRAELSDIDRQARTRETPPKPSNPLPFSKGDTSERTEAARDERAPGVETKVPADITPPKPEPAEESARVLPPADEGLRPNPDTSRPARGALGDALRNLERYVQNQTFNNPQGGANDPGSTIQFDTKGVDFGPWVRRFVSRVRRNWFIPDAAMTFRGRVVMQFNIHRNGSITDIVVADPSGIDAFNRAAFNAILGSNPVEPLPLEYPEPKAFFTVTFYYNEQPPGQ